MNTKELIPFLKFLSSESSAIIKQYFRTDLAIDNKADDSPVTIADKKTEERM